MPLPLKRNTNMMIIVTNVHTFRQKQEYCFIFKSSQNECICNGRCTCINKNCDDNS